MEPQLIQAMLQGGAQDPQQIELARKQKMIDMLRSNSMGFKGAPVMTRGGGVAPWGDAISAMAQAYAAHKMQPGVDEQRKILSARDQQTQARYLDALTMALRRPMPGANTPMLPPDGMEDR